MKTVRFRKPNYIGDPINAVRIFNDMEVDEIIVLDIGATPAATGIPFQLIAEMASECFMPMLYGGGVTSVDDARRILALGVEKVAVNSAAVADVTLVRRMADAFGAQAVVAAIDVHKRWFSGYAAYANSGRRRVRVSVEEWVRQLAEAGAGEILVNSIDRDGTMRGYDVQLVKLVASVVRVPVVAAGGAGSVQDMRDVVVNGGASAAAIGSLAVYQGTNRSVLINFPTPAQLKAVMS